MVRKFIALSSALFQIWTVSISAKLAAVLFPYRGADIVHANCRKEIMCVCVVCMHVNIHAEERQSVNDEAVKTISAATLCLTNKYHSYIFATRRQFILVQFTWLQSYLKYNLCKLHLTPGFTTHTHTHTRTHTDPDTHTHTDAVKLRMWLLNRNPPIRGRSHCIPPWPEGVTLLWLTQIIAIGWVGLASKAEIPGPDIKNPTKTEVSPN